MEGESDDEGASSREYRSGKRKSGGGKCIPQVVLYLYLGVDLVSLATVRSLFVEFGLARLPEGMPTRVAEKMTGRKDGSRSVCDLCRRPGAFDGPSP